MTPNRLADYIVKRYPAPIAALIGLVIITATGVALQQLVRAVFQ